MRQKAFTKEKLFGYVVVARYSYYRKSYFRLIELKREIEKQTGPSNDNHKEMRGENNDKRLGTKQLNYTLIRRGGNQIKNFSLKEEI